MLPQLYQKIAKTSLERNMKISVNSLFIIIIREKILLINTSSFTSWETSSIHNNFHVNDWCLQESPKRGEKFKPGFLRLLSYINLKNIGKAKIKTLINFWNKINPINLVYMTKLDLWIQKTDINNQKIDSSFL